MEYVVLNGVAEAADMLSQLSDKLGKQVCRSAAQAGATTMKKEVIARAPVSNVDRVKVYGSNGNKFSKYDYTRRHLRNQITTKSVKSNNADVKILINTGDAFWGVFTEKGTKKGISAQKWFKGAFESSENPVLDAIETKFTDAVMKNISA